MYIKKFFFALPVALLAVFFAFCTNNSFAQGTECPFVPGDPGTGCSFESTVWPDPSSWSPCCAGAAVGTMSCSFPNGPYRIVRVRGLEGTGISSRVKNGTGTSIITIFQTSGANVVTQKSFGGAVFFWFNFKMPNNLAVDPGVTFTARFEVERLVEGTWQFDRTIFIPVTPLQKPFFSGATATCTTVSPSLTIVVNRNMVPPLVECEPSSGKTLTWNITNGWLINGMPSPVTTTTASAVITRGNSQSETATLCVGPSNFNWFVTGNSICTQLNIASAVPPAPTDILFNTSDCSKCAMNTAIIPVPNATSYIWNGNYQTTSTAGPQVPMNNAGMICVKAANACGLSPNRCETYCFSSEDYCPDYACPGIGCPKRKSPSLPNTGISFWPNPVFEKGSLSVDHSLIGEGLSLEIFDPLGKAIFNQQVSETLTNIDVSGIAPGVYFLLLSNKEGIIATQKIVVE